MQAPTLSAACMQLRSGADIAANLRTVRGFAREARAEGAQYILTPENTSIMEEDKERLRGIVGTMKDDEAVRTLSELAQELEVFLHVGSLPLRSDEQGEKRLVNRSILFGPDGRPLAFYDKIHLFDVDVKGEHHRESAYIRPGEQAVMANAGGLRIGFSICYDVRFPGLYRTLALAGAQVFTIPAAFTVPTGRAHWHVLTRARAIENGAYVLAAAQGGLHESGRFTYGHSLIISPWGDILAEAGEEPTVLYATLDAAHVARVRQQIPVLQHERPFARPATPRVLRSV